jgi:hypothetical protein
MFVILTLYLYLLYDDYHLKNPVVQYFIPIPEGVVLEDNFFICIDYYT